MARTLGGVPILGPTDPLPNPRRANSWGFVAWGNELGEARLLDAYRRGIFPWPHGLPLIPWASPNPRCVLPPEALHVPRSLGKLLRRGIYQFTLDCAFERVMRECAAAPRPGQDGTWITESMVQAYVRLHELGHAHSAEAWLDGELVGGLYGVAVGRLFCGESMFAKAADASKAAFVTLTQQLADWQFGLIDAQVHTEHLERFGAELWPREVYLQEIEALVAAGGRVGKWTLEPTSRIAGPTE